MSWRAPTQKKPECYKCLDVGVVELIRGDIKTLGLCFCFQGSRQQWSLPMIPMKNYTDRPLNWADFKPKNEGEYQQRIAAWVERVQIAEDYWAENREEIA